jgi:hypothetical protein
MEIRMRVVPIAAALWAAHALAQSPAPTAPAPAPTASAPAPSTPAPTPAPTYTAPTPAPAPAAPAEQITNWGIMLGGGIPDGVGASAVFRPMTWLRLSAGGAYNFVAFGFHGGVSLVPLYGPFSPSLNVDVGHFLGGDATPILKVALQNSGYDVPDSPILKQVAYDYADATVGLEFGLPKTFTIFLRAGVSYIRTTLHNFQDLVQQAAGGPNGPDTSITAQDPTITLTAPSLKLGLIVYF